MERHAMSRRAFVEVVGATAAGLAAARSAFGADSAPSSGAHPLRLGAPVFNAPDDPEKLALAHRALGYRAAYCPDVALEDTARIKALADAFAKHDVAIAEVGRWCNMLDADPAKRKANVENVTNGLALADAIGARCCVDIAGSFNPEVWYGPHPKNFSRELFDAAVENARAIIDAVKPTRAKFCYEMMGWSLPEGADSYLKMLGAVDRPAFGVHLDICNAINSPQRYYDSAGLINECFDKLGPHIVSCHAKDLTWDVEMNVHFREVRPGAGSLDYALYLKRLAALPNDAPLMVEHLPNAEEYDAARKYLLEVGTREGIPFE